MKSSQFRTMAAGLLMVVTLAGCQMNPAGEDASLGKVVEAESALSAGELREAANLYTRAGLDSADPARLEAAADVVFEFGTQKQKLALLQHWRSVTPDDEQPVLLLARIALDDRDVEAAVTHFGAYRRLAPAATEDLAGPYEVIAGALAGSASNRADRLQIAERLVEADPDNWEARRMFFRVAQRADEQNLAMEAAEIAFELAPENFDAALIQAESIIMGGDRPAAFEFIRSQTDRISTPTQRLAFAAFLAGNDELDDAAGEVESLLLESPDDAPAQTAMGLLKLRQGEAEQAWETFSELAQNPAHQHGAVFYLAGIAEREGRAEQALRLYSQVGSGPNRLAAVQRISQILLRQGNSEAAVRHLEDFAREHPVEGFRLLLQRTSLLRELGRHDEALELYDYGLAVRPDSEAFLLSRAEIFLDEGDIDAAVKAYRAAVKAHPDSPLTLNALGYTLADRTDRAEEAHALIARALEMEPDNAAIIDSMGWAEFKLGRYETALGYLEHAWSLMKDPEVAAHLGETLWRLGEREQARQILKEAYDRSPDSEPLRRTLERLLKEAEQTTS